MIEENVAPLSTSGEGSGVGRNNFILNAEEFERLITDAGYTPHRRNTRYELL